MLLQGHIYPSRDFMNYYHAKYLKTFPANKLKQN